MSAPADAPPQERRLLVTGFGPFPGCAHNPTSWLMSELANAPPALPYGMALETAILPTEWDRAWLSLAARLARLQPCAVIAFGVSARARGFCLERFAYNEACEHEDAAGNRHGAGALSQEGPAWRAASLPVDDLVGVMRAGGLRAEVSTDPGRYICNAVLYRLLGWAEQCPWPVRAGFVHVPYPKESCASEPGELPETLSRQALLAGAQLLIRQVGERVLRPVARATHSVLRPPGPITDLPFAKPLKGS
jgi:pyroglutamyl-peptidase